MEDASSKWIFKIHIHKDDLHLLVNSDKQIDSVLPVKAALTYGPFIQENEAFALKLATGKVSSLKTAPQNARLVYRNAEGEELDIASPTMDDWHRFGSFLLSRREKYNLTSWQAQRKQESEGRYLRKCVISDPDIDGNIIVRFHGSLASVGCFPPNRPMSYTRPIDPLVALRDCCSHEVVIENCIVPIRREDLYEHQHTYSKNAQTGTTLFEFMYLYEDENGNRVMASSPDDDGYQNAVAAGRQTRITAW